MMSAHNYQVVCIIYILLTQIYNNNNPSQLASRKDQTSYIFINTNIGFSEVLLQL